MKAIGNCNDGEILASDHGASSCKSAEKVIILLLKIQLSMPHMRLAQREISEV